ncbi:MAG TPA: family 78 glycoside hydrolase catalytic domain, partial [Acidimicrobiia bacterium]
PATVRGPAGTAPWTHLVSVRTRIVEQPIKAVSLHTLPTGAVVADFGKVYAAVPTVTFHHGVKGRTITMHAGFLLDSATDAAQLGNGAVAGEVSVAHGTQHTDLSYTYVQRGGVEQFHPFDYLGFRYLQIDNPGEALTPSDVVALARHVAMPDTAPATFSSPSPTLDAIFQLGAHSSLYTAQEQFVDTPTREKGSWLYDGFHESVTAMSAFGDQNETRKSLTEFAQSQSRYWPNGAINKIYPTGLGAVDINESAEIYAEWVWQYWLHTGDRSLLEQVYPVLQNLSGYVAHSIDPKTDLVTNLQATSIYYDFPTVTRLNILGVNVFRRTASVGAVLQRPKSEIALQTERADALTSAINKRLTQPDGTYVDGLDTHDKQIAMSSQTTNAAAVVYGVAPTAAYPQLGAVIAKAGMSTVVQDAAEVLDALARTGHSADLVRILTDPHIDGWANILARGATFTWEVWNPSDLIGDGMSHGWGSNVLVSIQRDLLGVTPTSGAYATFTVQPPSAGLDGARGTVPTPNGPISVQWSRTSKVLTIDVTVPDSTRATVLSQQLGPGRHTVTSGG